MYEIIYYLYMNDLSSKTDLRILYKYQYYLTKKEKQENPEWGEYISRMDELYNTQR